MTLREKLRQDNPTWSNRDFERAIEEECPYFFYQDVFAYCPCCDIPYGTPKPDELCKTCWDVYIPVEVIEKLSCNSRWYGLVDEMKGDWKDDLS